MCEIIKSALDHNCKPAVTTVSPVRRYVIFSLSDIFNPVKNPLLTILARNCVGRISVSGLFGADLAVYMARAINTSGLKSPECTVLLLG